MKEGLRCHGLILAGHPQMLAYTLYLTVAYSLYQAVDPVALIETVAKAVEDARGYPFQLG